VSESDGSLDSLPAVPLDAFERSGGQSALVTNQADEARRRAEAEVAKLREAAIAELADSRAALFAERNELYERLTKAGARIAELEARIARVADLVRKAHEHWDAIRWPEDKLYIAILAEAIELLTRRIGVETSEMTERDREGSLPPRDEGAS
jgi:DNA repair exonuclease SbcCD ATPase subunit